MSGIPILTVSELQAFLKNIFTKANHHATYALPLIAPLAVAVLTVADDNSLRATKGWSVNSSSPFGQQLRFTFNGVAFKLKNTGRQDRSVILAYSHSTGPLLTLKEDSNPSTITSVLLAALKSAVKKAA